MRIEIFSKYCQKIVNEVKRKILLQWSPKSHKGKTFWLHKRRKMESNPIFFLLLPNTGWCLNGSMWVSRYHFLSWVRPRCCLGCRWDGTFSLRLSRGQENWDPDTALPLLNWVASCESFCLSLTFLICDMKGLNLTPLLPSGSFVFVTQISFTHWCLLQRKPQSGCLGIGGVPRAGCSKRSAQMKAIRWSFSVDDLKMIIKLPRSQTKFYYHQHRQF